MLLRPIRSQLRLILNTLILNYARKGPFRATRFSEISTRMNDRYRDKIVPAQTSPMVRFVPHAKRRPKNRCFLRGNAHYPLRRDVADSAFLQQAEVAVSAAEAHFFWPAQFRLPPQRTDFGAALRHDH